MAEYPGFIGPAYRSQSVSASGDVLINLYIEKLQRPGASKANFYGTPGTKQFATTSVPTGVLRGMLTYSPTERNQISEGGNAPITITFVVIEWAVYQLNENGSLTLFFNLAPNGDATTPVFMEYDGTCMCISVNGLLVAFTVAGGAHVITLPSACGNVAYIDGYFITYLVNTTQFYISNLFDGTTWDLLDFAKKSGSPDPIIGIVADHRELWLFGSQTTEIWWDSGPVNAGLFPFSRLQGPFIQIGCAAPQSIVKVDNSHFWIHQDERGTAMIWRAAGYTPSRISTYAIEYAMSTYLSLTDAIAYAYQDGGHTFYVLNFPRAFVQQPQGFFVGATWVYDVAEDEWHQREWQHPDNVLDPLAGISDCIVGLYHTYNFGKHLVGGKIDNIVYEQSLSYFQDRISNVLASSLPALPNNPIRRVRRAPHLINQHKRVAYPCFELHIQQGLIPSGITAVFNLRISNDGGLTWGNYKPRTAGLTGQTLRRLLWRCLGQGRDRVFECSSDAPIQHAWINAYLDPDPIASAQ